MSTVGIISGPVIVIRNSSDVDNSKHFTKFCDLKDCTREGMA